MPPPEQTTRSYRDSTVTGAHSRGSATEDAHAGPTPLLTAASSERIKLVCLLPARNAAVDLPSYLESAARFCDAIVALDDGSTDETRRLLEECPLVKVLLTNPPREGYQGWNDAENRNRLLEAAAELNPEWIISIDADERLDPDDAAALRDFLDHDALPGCAYGFRVFSMQYDLQHYVPEVLWVYRLFAYEPGQSFPGEERLHFVPVPTGIPRALWIKTTLRIQHLGYMTPERRRANSEKYRQADPNPEYQPNYMKLRPNSLSGLRRWEPRPASLHVLLEANAVEESNLVQVIEEPSNAPAISAVILANDAESRIAQVLASVVNQRCTEPFEVIVVASGTDRTATVARKKFPQITVIELPHPVLPGEARNAGLRSARGTHICFHNAQTEMPLENLATRLRAHRLGYTMVTGVTLNEVHTWAGWASYFLDHAADLPSQTSAALDGPPAHCSYARGPLLEAGGFPEDLHGGEEVTVNTELFNRGYLAYRSLEVRSFHRCSSGTLRQFTHHYFVRGRNLGRIVLEDNAENHGLLLEAGFLESRLLMYLPHRLKRIRQNVLRWGQLKHRLLYYWVLPLLVVGLVAAWLGMWSEILWPSGRKSPILLGRTGRMLYEKTRRRYRNVGSRLRRAGTVFFSDQKGWDKGLLVLVDKNIALPEDYVPWDLVSLESYGVPMMGNDLLLREEAAKHLSWLIRAANAAGEKLVVTSAYRSFQYQRSLFDELARIYGHDAAGAMCALPGHSQHQLGTTVDFTSEDAGFGLVESFADTSAGRWLYQHASEYGFVLAYPRGGEAETGYQWEPWHYRYIGVENVRRLRANGMSLQRFLLGEGVFPGSQHYRGSPS